mmetsp:Transcript_38787/g.77768  ORF Transcript_38787/g.77768 Transcript_38787/m.77768 type:complete len:355 (+) Transcript_38787:230-1294(+)|eukprot:CAMPEP_0196741002 /NCGR_PEP_ID=MMETSP1091-20130531/37026_1 /TAXON_ID=302021 /ORGANISM="Rhodomonas sp., Strain CCMP768" /LENGTH=354 /DNA_ID=CAMNT_0042086461 /DNA_START=222 /DNA_END=1286 /DNA_ORIENTATION=-
MGIGEGGGSTAGIIAQVDRNGQQVGGISEENPETEDRRPSIFRKFLCGCFAPLISNRDGFQSPFPNAGLLRIGCASKDSTQTLPPLLPEKINPNKVTLILDLDETLVHSSFQPVENPDFVIPVEVDGAVHRVFVCKRPGVDEFMRTVGELFEVVVFTASLDKYANPVLDLLDKTNSVHFRLFREACVMADGSLVKDLTRLGRDLHKIIIVDNSPTSYMLQPQNAVPISSWFDDVEDRQLNNLLPWFVGVAKADDVLPSLSELRSCMLSGFGLPPQPSHSHSHDQSTHGSSAQTDPSLHGLAPATRGGAQAEDQSAERREEQQQRRPAVTTEDVVPAVEYVDEGRHDIVAVLGGA